MVYIWVQLISFVLLYSDKMTTFGENIVSSGIIGASVYGTEPLEVLLTFKNERSNLNITGNRNHAWAGTKNIYFFPF